jgi:hypothetical protein
MAEQSKSIRLATVTFDPLTEQPAIPEVRLEAQRNRQGGGGNVTNIRDLAQDVWTHITAAGLPPRPLPDDFIPRNVQTRPIVIPPGRAELIQPGLFDDDNGHACRFGTTTVRFDSLGERDYCYTLARSGIHREVALQGVS